MQAVRGGRIPLLADNSARMKLKFNATFAGCIA
jgi:hypothetical protein